MAVAGRAEAVQAQRQRGVRQRQGIALIQQGSHTGGQGAVSVFPGAQQQAGQPGRQGQLDQLPAQGRGQQFLRAGLDGSQPGQLFPGHGQMGLGRQVQPGQVFGPACAPDGQLQAERRKVRIQDLRPLLGAETVFFGLLPQAAADAGLQTPARCRAPASETRTVSRRERPLAGSKRLSRERPASTTRRMPSMVREVSAMAVARTTLRSPAAAGAMAASCSCGLSIP